MLFSLFCNADTLGEVRYGLACSDIIDCVTDTATPLIPLIIYTLLGNTNGPVQLCQPTFAIPPVPAPVIQDRNPVTRSRFKKFTSTVVCMHEFWRGATNLIFVFKKKAKNIVLRTDTPSGAVSRSFLLNREPDAVASPVRSIGPLTTTFTQSPTAYVGTKIFDLFTPFSPALPKTPFDEQRQAVEDPVSSNASLVPFDQIEISLTESIGHGASGQVFIGTADDEKYAIKIAPWKNGKQMLRREADIYEILSDLQGRCIPKIYGFFGSEHLKALVMAYMGRSVGSISDLSLDQRYAISPSRFFGLIILSMAMVVISYWKDFVSFTNAEFCMEIFELPTSSCRMDLPILSISHMDTNINVQGARHALSLLRHVNSCC